MLPYSNMILGDAKLFAPPWHLALSGCCECQEFAHQLAILRLLFTLEVHAAVRLTILIIFLSPVTQVLMGIPIQIVYLFYAFNRLPAPDQRSQTFIASLQGVFGKHGSQI